MANGKQTLVSDIASAAGLDYNWCISDGQQHNHIPAETTDWKSALW